MCVREKRERAREVERKGREREREREERLNEQYLQKKSDLHPKPRHRIKKTEHYFAFNGENMSIWCKPAQRKQ